MEKFKKGDYIVPLSDDSLTNNWNGCVLKQRRNGDYIYPEIDPNTGSRDNSWAPDDLIEGVDWRYATTTEIREYDLHGKPFTTTDDSNTLIGKKMYGFKFNDACCDYAYVSGDMDKYVGKIGTIVRIDETTVKVDFESDFWWYPLEMVTDHLVGKSESNQVTNYEIY